MHLSVTAATPVLWGSLGAEWLVTWAENRIIPCILAMLVISFWFLHQFWNLPDLHTGFNNIFGHHPGFGLIFLDFGLVSD